MKKTTLVIAAGALLYSGSAQASTIFIGDLGSQTPTKTYAAATTIPNADFSGGAGNVDSTQDVAIAWDMTLVSTTPAASRRTLIDLGGGAIGFAVTWTNAGIFAQIQDTAPNPDSKIGGNGTGSTAALVYVPTAADLNVSKEWVVSLDVDGTSSTLNMFVDGSLIGSVGGVPVTDWAGGDGGGFFTRSGSVLTDVFSSGTGANGPGAAEATASNMRLYNDTFVAVPEPSAVMLLGGLSGLALIARRRR